MVTSKQIGLALSGGGYRAAIYHLGTLKKLEELGILANVDRLSTISGGSITGAAFCLHVGGFANFEKKMFDALTTKSVIRFILTSWEFIRLILFSIIFLGSSVYLQFTSLSVLSIPIRILFIFLLIKFQFKIFPVSKIIERAYDEFFYSGAVLSQLCDKPELAIGSTNLQTLRQFTFSKRKMEDSKYAYMNPPILFEGSKFPISRAVIASSSVPFAFTPIVIDKEFYKNPEQYNSANPRLVDGGVYDNQGAHKLTQKNSSYRCDIVIVSDAGNKLPFDKSYSNTFTLLLRTVDAFMARIKHFQMIQNLYSVTDISLSFQSIGWDLNECIFGFYNNLKNGNVTKELCELHGLEAVWIEKPGLYKSEIIKQLKETCNYIQIMAKDLSVEQIKCIRNVGTNLTPIKTDLAKNLITHAENITELQIRLYCPQIIQNNAI